MKKIILLLILLLCFARADIKKGTTNVIPNSDGDRVFTYYCIDGGLWLEVYVEGRQSPTYKFEQVNSPGSTATPMRCNVFENRFEIKN